MKKLLLYIGAGILLLSACHDLNLNPLSSGSTENWYSTETEVQMAVESYIDMTSGRKTDNNRPTGRTTILHAIS